eukprot:1154726-Pelagomonas_calceolata.AAC.1
MQQTSNQGSMTQCHTQQQCGGCCSKSRCGEGHLPKKQGTSTQGVHGPMPHTAAMWSLLFQITMWMGAPSKEARHQHTGSPWPNATHSSNVEPAVPNYDVDGGTFQRGVQRTSTQGVHGPMPHTAAMWSL